MIPIGPAKLENAIDIHRARIVAVAADAKDELEKVKRDHSSTLNAQEISYLDKVIDLFKDEEFICSNQDTLREKIKLLPKLPARTFIKDSAGQSITSLTSHIQEALGYERLRKSFYPTFYRSLGVRTCVYCNALSALTVQKWSPQGRSLTIKGKYQLDHYFSKDDYPFLSVCFYNLYLVCGICNNAKKKSAVDFDFYGDQPTKPYRFELSPGTVAKYLLTHDHGTIKIIFHDPDKEIQDPDFKSFQEVFNIQGIYETQTDIAEELIIKSQIYSESYKDSLRGSFPGLFSNEDLSNRLLIGNYMDIKDIHIRPMAKFMQDIAKQLDILKNSRT